MKTSNKQRGMAALTMIMVIVILLAIIGTVIATSRTSANTTGDQKTKLMASSIIDQGNSLRNGAVIMVTKGNVSALNYITMDTTDNSASTGYVGLFNGTKGGTVIQSPPSEAVTATTEWVYFIGGGANGIENSGVAASAAATSYGFAIKGLTQPVCLMIDKLHYGESFAAIPAATGTYPAAGSITNSIAGAGFQVDAYNNATATTKGWNFGCVNAGGSYVYFNIVQP